MPKRQPKPEPITPEEVMGSPAPQGFDSFLRYHRSADESESGGAGKSTGEAGAELSGTPDQPDDLPTDTSLELPIGDQPIAYQPMGDKPVGDKPVGESLDTATSFVIPEFKPGPKIRRAVKAQDGHSAGEQAVYQALWNAASVETPDSRLIRVGYGGLQSLCGLDKTNCKDNIQSLIRKLAVEVVSPFSVQRNQGNAYRVFSPSSVLKRRKAAGMEWVIRNKGVRFVNHSPIGE